MSAKKVLDELEDSKCFRCKHDMKAHAIHTKGELNRVVSYDCYCGCVLEETGIALDSGKNLREEDNK